MEDLVAYPLLFTTRVTSPLELDDHSGASLRGNLCWVCLGLFFMNKKAQNCAECPLHAMCPVSALVAPLREENGRGRDIPRPYIILPPLGSARHYEPGETLIFGLTLFGNIIRLLPYIMMSLEAIAAGGLGRKLQENSWQRGKFKIQQVESYNPFTGERQIIYEAGKPLVTVPTLAISTSDIKCKAAQLSTECASLRFLTPTRIIDQEVLVHTPVFRPLIQRLLERLTALQKEYGQEREQEDESVIDEGIASVLVQLSKNVHCTDKTRWEEVRSHSRRQQRFTQIGGFIGQATFNGNIAPFRELLVWGELIHVGKNTVKGNGWYTIESLVL